MTKTIVVKAIQGAEVVAEVHDGISNYQTKAAVMLCYMDVNGECTINGDKYKLRVVSNCECLGEAYTRYWRGALELDEFLETLLVVRDGGNWNSYMLGKKYQGIGFWDMGSYENLLVGLFRNGKLCRI